MDNFISIKSPVNIALIKYWGKLDYTLNIPLNSSFSLTLSRNNVYSLTKIRYSKENSFKLYDQNRVLIDEKFPKGFEVILMFFKNYSKRDFHVEIDSTNSFPSSAGLASSASGLCATVLSFARLCNFFEENDQELS